MILADNISFVAQYIQVACHADEYLQDIEFVAGGFEDWQFVVPACLRREHNAFQDLQDILFATLSEGVAVFLGEI